MKRSRRTARLGELLAGMHELLAQGKMDEILSAHIDAYGSRKAGTAEDREALLIFTSLRDCPFEVAGRLKLPRQN